MSSSAAFPFPTEGATSTTGPLQNIVEVLKGVEFESVPASSVACTTALAVLTYVVVSCVYSRYFHPLSKFPGPFWASITNFWKLYILSTKQSHTKGLDGHKQYGPIIRVAPNLLVFNDPKLLPIVYGRNVDKSDFYSLGVLGGTPPPFQTKPAKEHAAKRKRVAPSFQITNLRKQEGEFDASIERLLAIFSDKYVDQAKEAPLDLTQWTKWFVYDTISSLAFGKTIGFVEQGKDVDGLVECFHEMAPMAAIVGALPHLINPIMKIPILGKKLMPHPGDGTGIGKIMQYRDNMLADRFADRHAQLHGDFLDHMLNAKNADGSYMTEEEIKAEALVLMVAGPDTTAAFIGPFVQHVTANPQIRSRLRAEIQDFESQGKLNPSGVATFEETKKMPYFMACVQETLRFSPSTPVVLPRVATKGGYTLNGQYVPEGTELAANPYVIHRDQGIFGKDAMEFNPERWLESEERSREMNRYIMSWGYGARECLGKNIASMLIQKLCLEMFRRFDFKSMKPDNPWREQNWALMIYFDQWVTISRASKGVDDA